MTTIHTLDSSLQATTDFLNAVASFSPVKMDIDQKTAQAWARDTAHCDVQELWLEERAEAGSRMIVLVSEDGPQVFADVTDGNAPIVSYTSVGRLKAAWNGLQRVIEEQAFEAMDCRRGNGAWAYGTNSLTFSNEHGERLGMRTYETIREALDDISDPEMTFRVHPELETPVAQIVSAEVSSQNPDRIVALMADHSTEELRLHQIFTLESRGGARYRSNPHFQLPDLNMYCRMGHRFYLRKVEEARGLAQRQLVLEFCQFDPAVSMKAFPVRILVQTDVSLETMKKHLGVIKVGNVDESHPSVQQLNPIFMCRHLGVERELAH